MSTQKTITVQLDAHDYERLEAEARRKGVELDLLVQMYVHHALPNNLPDSEQHVQKVTKALEALDRLAEIRADLPPVDAVKIARESREELERRSDF